jgi:hypothetical protein
MVILMISLWLLFVACIILLHNRIHTKNWQPCAKSGPVWTLVSRPACLGVKPPSEAQDQIFCTVKTVGGLLTWGALSDERTGLSFTTAAIPRQRSHSQVRVSRDPWPYFTVSDSRLPQPGEPGTCIYIAQEQGGPVIPQVMGSLFVAAYNSHDYGGGIRTRLHAGIIIQPRHGLHKNHRVPQQWLNSSSTVTSRVLCRGKIFRSPLPSTGWILSLNDAVFMSQHKYTQNKRSKCFD